MNFETKYSLGQELHGISLGDLSRSEPCTLCKDGTITVSGETFNCPKCKGRQVVIVGKQRWHVLSSGIVDVVSVVAIAEPVWREPLEYTYMLDTHGTAGGTIWKEANMFPSRAEAIAECDRRNAKLDGDVPVQP